MNRRATAALALVPGIAICGALATIATVFGRLAPVVGAPVFAIVGGMVAATTFETPAITRAVIGV